jgi:hypothetical protein
VTRPEKPVKDPNEAPMDGLPVDDGSREAPNVNARQPGESFRRIPPGARREEVEHAKDCRDEPARTGALAN